MTTILVTGATGTVGSKVVALLARREGVTVRAAARSRSKAEELERASVVPVELDYEMPDLVARALEGASSVFFLAPSLPDQVGASARFFDLARAAGVKHVVKLSAFQCDVEPTIAFGRAHRDAERLLASSGLAWTALRPNNFMDNFLGVRHGVFAPDAHGEIALPWGDGACSFIAAEDIAAAAACVLTSEGHAGKAYELTGPEALRLGQVADLLASASGRRIRYVDVPDDVTRRKMLDARMPPQMADGVMELHVMGKTGRSALVTSAVEDLTGRPARTFADFARANAAAWRLPR